MGQPSFQASNAIVYVTYGAFLYVKTRFPAKMAQLIKDLILPEFWGRHLRGDTAKTPKQSSSLGTELGPVRTITPAGTIGVEER